MTNPFDDIRTLILNMPQAHVNAVEIVREREAQLTKPAGSLGRLEEITQWYAAWSGQPQPKISKPLMAIFAANHGVARHGVSAFPPEVTAQMVQNFADGGAAINQLCQINGIALQVFELALEKPTEDFTCAPALQPAEWAATFAYGMECLASRPDLLCVGEMGIGNTTSAAAIYTALYGGSAHDWVGLGTGINNDILIKKCEVIDQAISFHKDNLTDPLRILQCLGGREIIAIAGAIVGARYQNIPVVLDGFVTTAAAAVVHAINPNGVLHCLAAHASAEQAHKKILKNIALEPLLDLNMRLGEGSGAALAASIVKSAITTHSGMNTFESAKVANKNQS